MARMALELAVTMAPPTPTSPLQRISWVVEKEVAAINAGPGQDYGPNEVNADVAVLLAQPGRQKDGAAQHQQADDHHPGGLGDVHLEVASY